MKKAGKRQAVVEAKAPGEKTAGKAGEKKAGEKKTAGQAAEAGQAGPKAGERKAPRPVWSGAVSIGLVNVPVKVYPMTRDLSVHFHLLHRKDGQPLKYERVCTRDGMVIPWEETAKGYEVRKNEFIALDKEELRAALPESDRRIRLDKFVHYLSLDPVYFDNSFVLVPDGVPDAYGLLYTACQELGEAGVGRFTMRTKEYPAVVHAYHGALVLTTFRYANEVIDPSVFEELKSLSTPNGKELELAKKIITDLTGDLDITDYHDTYRERVLAIIEKKRAGETIKVERPKAAEVKELMSALEETVAKLGKQ
ncbi:MAG TPA: Ku protein [Methanomicrobiales archaeon]|jgi:DNA end-binding protein Ku|nr:Ku protein [Methanomicrobiales archaeon]